jgi:hypothetical protein
MASKDGDLLEKVRRANYRGNRARSYGREGPTRHRSFSIPSGTERQLYSSRLDQGDGITDITVEYNKKYYWMIQGHRKYLGYHRRVGRGSKQAGNGRDFCCT